MTGPRTALALAHRRYVCGIDAPVRGLDREDLEVADTLARLLADQGYEIVSKAPIR
jgi:hypothetical protein